MIATYQTRIHCEEAPLIACASLYGLLERRLYGQFAVGIVPTSLKSQYLRDHRIPARMFNSLRVSVEGKIASARESQGVQRTLLERQLARARKELAKTSSPFSRHHRRRRLSHLEQKLRQVDSDLSSGKVRLCFGSRRLWRKQHDLAANGYNSHEEWLHDWRTARSDEFYIMGSRDETAGCLLCVATIADDGSLNLRLRLPACLAGEHGKYLTIQGVRFAYGHEQILAALHNNVEYGEVRRQHGIAAARASGLGQAISYRFKRDGKGWRVFATIRVIHVPLVTDKRRGAIGLDINTDHLAVAETDASGNFVRARRVPLVTYGKSSQQAEALIGDAVACVVQYAKESGKPISIEKLDFRQKRGVLEGESPRYSRMVSSFAYGKIKAYFLSRGYGHGVEVKQVNPAYSSVIGRVKFMERYGLSAHQAAALVLARRSLGFSERVPRRRVAPVGNGMHVAFTVPARKRAKHVWSHWGAVSGQLRPALAAQRRLGKVTALPNLARAGPFLDPFAAPG